MTIRKNRDLMEKLAAEYVLGTLKGGARRRFEYWLQDDAALQAAVERWQTHLQPMAELSAAVAPPPRVWESVARKTKAPASAAKRVPGPIRTLYENLQFWRGLGIASTVLTVFLTVGLFRDGPGAASTAALDAFTLAILADDQSQPVALVTGKPDDKRITVRMIMPQSIGNDKALELWAVPAIGKPKSLGLLKTGGSVELSLPETVTPANSPVLAATLEPKGGSPDPNGATGPIVFKGAWIKL